MNLKISNFDLIGFSLLEILIVIVILSIIASIAIPVYRHEVVKARRNDAQVALLNLATLMERYYIENHTYQGATIGNNGTILIVPTSANGYYNLSIHTPKSTNYTLTANPISTQLADDTQCGTLSINQLGVKMISGTGTVNQCWQ